jgi:hypothetical protein
MEQAQLAIALALGSFTILGLWAGLIRKMVTYYLSELKPDGNGGHNLHGRVERIEQRVDKIYELLLSERLSR